MPEFLYHPHKLNRPKAASPLVNCMQTGVVVSLYSKDLVQLDLRNVSIPEIGKGLA